MRSVQGEIDDDRRECDGTERDRAAARQRLGFFDGLRLPRVLLRGKLHGVENRDQVGHGVPPGIWLGGETTHDRIGYLDRHSGTDGRELLRHLGEALDDEFLRRRFLERGATSEELVRDDAKGVDVGPVIEMTVAGGLLGAHVVGSPHDHAGSRELRLFRIDGLGNPEIHQERSTLRAFEEDVLRLEIAVHDAGSMRRHQRARQLTEDAMRFAKRHRWPILQSGRERFTFDLGHDEVGEIFRVTDRVDRHDVGVPQLGDRLGFALESLNQ